MENLVFKDFNLSKELQKAIADMGFEEPTPIQSRAIPLILKKQDIIGQAQTGTGKTCAFGIPTIESIEPNSTDIQMLVLCPTRELALQSVEELNNVAKYKQGIKIIPVYGGQPIERQIQLLKKHPQIVIGTPGRIMDHMRRHTLKLGNIKTLVLDEADEMLNMGFKEDIDVILQKVPQERQTLLFSATMPKEILDITHKYQNNPVLIKVVHQELTVSNTEQYYVEVRGSNRLDVLTRIIDVNDFKLALVFCNTKRRVDELNESLKSRGYLSEALHGDMRQVQRDKVMAKFRKGTIDILIATDVAARGIDVDDIEVVFNYDLPNDEEYYVHRIGRTGRAGKTGKSYSFVFGREINRLRDIQRYTKSAITAQKAPSPEDIREIKLSKIFDDVKELISSGKLSKHTDFIENFIEDSSINEDSDNYITTIDIASALLKMVMEGSNNSSPTKSSSNDYADSLSENGMVRLFLNVGRNVNIQPRNIIETMASKTSIPGNAIGAINIFDKYTFVEVPPEYANEIISKLKKHKINGKQINVEAANKR